MFDAAFQDLLKPQWLMTLRELKLSGGLPIGELAKRVGVSYMTVKQHCEDLTELGYLLRSRLPRKGIGRPEIFYRLSEKSDELFPQISQEFCMKMLEQVARAFGEMAPEKLLYQHFMGLQAEWERELRGLEGKLETARKFVKIREKEGLFLGLLEAENGGELVLKVFHHPFAAIFNAYPRVMLMEQRAMEAALGVKLRRGEVAALDGRPAYVEFTFGE